MTMIHRALNFFTAIGLSLCLVATSLAAAEMAAHDHGTAPSRLQLNAGKKWATDAPLRKGMENIRNAMDAALQDIHASRLSAAQYTELAKKVNGEVNGIVASCKLDPQADAQLHIIIANTLEGAEVMQGKIKGSARQNGAVKILGALKNYAVYFDHPNWKPIRH